MFDALPNEIIEKILSYIQCINDMPYFYPFIDTIEYIKKRKNTLIINNLSEFDTIVNGDNCCHYFIGKLSEIKKIEKESDKVYFILNDFTKYSFIFNNLKKPDVITKIISLEELDLCDSELEKLPDEIGNLINLKKLLLSSNNLKELPSSITNLKKLSFLCINKNYIRNLPEFPDIRYLRIDYDEIKIIHNLSNITVLYIDNCCLEQISKNINEMKYLKELYINNYDDTLYLENFSSSIKNIISVLIDIKIYASYPIKYYVVYSMSSSYYKSIEKHYHAVYDKRGDVNFFLKYK
jgi:hypothetical protein